MTPAAKKFGNLKTSNGYRAGNCLTSCHIRAVGTSGFVAFKAAWFVGDNRSQTAKCVVQKNLKKIQGHVITGHKVTVMVQT